MRKIGVAVVVIVIGVVVHAQTLTLDRDIENF